VPPWLLVYFLVVSPWSISPAADLNKTPATHINKKTDSPSPNRRPPPGLFPLATPPSNQPPEDPTSTNLHSQRHFLHFCPQPSLLSLSHLCHSPSPSHSWFPILSWTTQNQPQQPTYHLSPEPRAIPLHSPLSSAASPSSLISSSPSTPKLPLSRVFFSFGSLQLQPHRPASRPARTQRRPQTQICPPSSSSSSCTDVVPFLNRQIICWKKEITTNHTRERIWTKRKLKINCCLCVFSLIASGGDPHRRRRKTEKKKTFPIHRFCCLHRRRRVEETRRHYSCSSSSLPLQFLDF